MTIYDPIVMRKSSKPQHPVGVLREILGMGQTELAEMVGCSPRTIQAVEINRLPLSKDLARRISRETSVSVGWLLKGDKTAKPYVYGPVHISYTKEHFEQTRALIQQRKEPTFLAVVGDEAAKEKLGPEAWELLKSREEKAAESWPVDMPMLLLSILATMKAATHLGRQELAAYRLWNFVGQFSREFGQKVDEKFVDDSGDLLIDCLFKTFRYEQQFESGVLSPFFWSRLVPPEQWVNVPDPKGRVLVDVTVPEGMDRDAAEKFFREGKLHRTSQRDAIVLRKMLEAKNAERADTTATPNTSSKSISASKPKKPRRRIERAAARDK